MKEIQVWSSSEKFHGLRSKVEKYPLLPVCQEKCQRHQASCRGGSRRRVAREAGTTWVLPGSRISWGMGTWRRENCVSSGEGLCGCKCYTRAHTHTTYRTVSALESEAETERSRQRRWVEPAPQWEGVPASSWGSSLGCGGQCAQGPSGEVEVRVCGVNT